MMWARSFAIWLGIIVVETIHGILRTVLLAPVAGDFRARQIAVFTGALLIVAVAWLSIAWIGARTTRALIAIGCAWTALTLAFEVGLGRLLGYPWERIAEDYDVARGGLLPFGLLVMTLAPLMAARLRGQRTSY